MEQVFDGSSSDEDLPLIRRQVASDIMANNNKLIQDDSSDSSLPSWLEEQGRQKRERDVVSNGKDVMMIIDTDSDSEEIQKPSTSMKRDGQIKIDAVSEGKMTQESTPMEDSHAAVLLTQPSIKTKAAVTGPKNTGTTAATLNDIVDANSVTVRLPDKMPVQKMLMELESHDTLAGTTDLSGDSGAIGRMLLRKTREGDSTVERMELDLKGCIYSVTPVEYPGTIMVLNFTGSEAKVESISDRFIQLREDKRFSNEEDAAKLKEWLEDDENDSQTEGNQNAHLGTETASASQKKGGARKKPAVKKAAPRRKTAAKPRAKAKKK
ncbi:DNA-binding protein BIN4 [Picochlorum sp. SENEW3]|nr:DNA-binding protein BIN4 [Picochlorum sp. SENEW3]